MRGLQAPTEWDGKSVLRMQISLLTLKACVCVSDHFVPGAGT